MIYVRRTAPWDLSPEGWRRSRLPRAIKAVFAGKDGTQESLEFLGRYGSLEVLVKATVRNTGSQASVGGQVGVRPLEGLEHVSRELAATTLPHLAAFLPPEFLTSSWTLQVAEMSRAIRSGMEASGAQTMQGGWWQNTFFGHAQDFASFLTLVGEALEEALRDYDSRLARVLVEATPRRLPFDPAVFSFVDRFGSTAFGRQLLAELIRLSSERRGVATPSWLEELPRTPLAFREVWQRWRATYGGEPMVAFGRDWSPHTRVVDRCLYASLTSFLGSEARLSPGRPHDAFFEAVASFLYEPDPNRSSYSFARWPTASMGPLVARGVPSRGEPLSPSKLLEQVIHRAHRRGGW